MNKLTLKCIVFGAALLISNHVYAVDFFDGDEKRIIASAFQHFMDQQNGMIGLQVEIGECYQTAYKSGLGENFLYCFALDTQAMVMESIQAENFKRAPMQYFDDATYNVRVRKNLAEVGVTNPYKQTKVINQMKNELNIVAGQYVRRTMAGRTPDDKLPIE